MSLLRIVAIAAALLGAAPAFAQETSAPRAEQAATITITAKQLSGHPTLLSYLAQKPLPETTEALVARLNEPTMCGKEVWPAPNPHKPCAVIVYYLVDREETARTPLLAFRALYFVTHPSDPAETTLLILDLDGKVKTFSGAKLDEPLRPMRVPNSCAYRWDRLRDEDFKVKKCQRVDALYEPLGILGYIENDQQKILTGKVKDSFFSTF
jgi:hypothetical protein